ncbi:hypothetical protein K435DRAFT_853580 [Dendrothele bispora CBS 962.96]|uniref:Uncharacterized protein n=1 Tax=Dendrothele bispora (strain CBS 962.96) TaxID=1314807 RepID=A0A4S8MHD1_DENBC|nr:hypothetical protein K435DRAFT_853580 [Dendrothele bispora CBS 962.96]
MTARLVTQGEERRLREERDKARDELRRADREVDDLKEEVQKGNRSYDRLYADFKELRRENDDLKGEVNRLRRENARQTRPDQTRTIAPIPSTTPSQARSTPTNVVPAPNTPVQFILTPLVKGTVAEKMEISTDDQPEKTMDVRLEETSDEESDDEEETSGRGKGKSGPKRFGKTPDPLNMLHTPRDMQRGTLRSEISPILMPENATQANELLARTQEQNNWEAVRRVQTILAVFQATNHRIKRNEIQTTPSWWNVVQDLSMRWRLPGWMESAKQLEAAYNSGQEVEVLKVIKVNQANPNMPLEEQARWMAVNATPFTHPGILVSETLAVDLQTIQAYNYFQVLGSKLTANMDKRRYQQLFLELVAQPYLYEQLLSHWSVTVKVQKLTPIRVSSNTSFEDLVKELAEAGLTTSMANGMHNWAMQWLHDARTTLPENSHEWGCIMSLAADRIRQFGVPPCPVRVWHPPPEWDIAEAYEQRLRRLAWEGKNQRFPRVSGAKRRRDGNHGRPVAESSGVAPSNSQDVMRPSTSNAAPTIIEDTEMADADQEPIALRQPSPMPIDSSGGRSVAGPSETTPQHNV